MSTRSTVLDNPKVANDSAAGGSGLDLLDFDFCSECANGLATPHDLVFEFPTHLGGGRQGGTLSGSWSGVAQPDGDFEVATMDARLTPIAVPVETEAGLRHVSTGLISLSAEAPDVGSLDFALAKELGPIGIGRMDADSGLTSSTLGFTLRSPGLADCGIDGVPVVVAARGTFDAGTGLMFWAGTGRIVAGPLAGTVVRMDAPQKKGSTFKVAVDPNPVERKKKSAKVTVTISPAKQDRTIALSAQKIKLTGWASGSTLSIPASVTVKAGKGSASTTLSYSKVSSKNRGKVTASVGGKSTETQFGVI